MNERKTDRTSVFAVAALAFAILAMLATVVVAIGGFGSGSESYAQEPGQPALVTTQSPTRRRIRTRSRPTLPRRWLT
jgi:hypothetical protein